MVRAILENFKTVFEKSDIEKKKILLKSITEHIWVSNGKFKKLTLLIQIKSLKLLMVWFTVSNSKIFIDSISAYHF